MESLSGLTTATQVLFFILTHLLWFILVFRVPGLSLCATDSTKVLLPCSYLASPVRPGFWAAGPGLWHTAASQTGCPLQHAAAYPGL